MQLLAGHVASWVGTNGFRLMPNDPLHRAEATARVATAAGGHMATIAYTWVHPLAGANDGLLAVGVDSDGVVALWGDSWHQTPAPAVLHGVVADGVIRLSYTYAEEWVWQIAIDPRDPSGLQMQMDNVVPESAVTEATGPGAYPAMVMELRRATAPGSDPNVNLGRGV